MTWISVSNRVNDAASPAHDHEPSRTRQRCAPAASTVPSAMKDATSVAGRSRNTAAMQGHSFRLPEPLKRVDR